MTAIAFWANADRICSGTINLKAISRVVAQESFAIWLRAEFPVQRMRTRFLSAMSAFNFRVRDHDSFCVFGQ